MFRHTHTFMCMHTHIQMHKHPPAHTPTPPHSHTSKCTNTHTHTPPTCTHTPVTQYCVQVLLKLILDTASIFSTSGSSVSRKQRDGCTDRQGKKHTCLCSHVCHHTSSMSIARPWFNIPPKATKRASNQITHSKQSTIQTYIEHVEMAVVSCGTSHETTKQCCNL